VVWYDLLTEDATKVLGFYRELFGWEAVQHRDRGWALLHHGRLIGGISEIPDDHPELEEGMWLVGIAVSEVDAAVEKAVALGAKLELGPAELTGFASYAVITDLENAPLLLVDPQVEMGGERSHGAFVWTELWSKNPSTAAAFYGEVIGFDQARITVNGNPYVVFESTDTRRAGLVTTPLESIDPAWVPYIGVDDLESTLDRVGTLGGRVIVPPHAEFANGSVALITDPGGAAFFMYHLGGIGEVKE
jgi:predicted enzyme related to lactoylglutathione lyase